MLLNMIIPIRCFSCGKLIADRYEKYLEMRDEGIPIDKIWKDLGIRKFCCKRMITSQKDSIDNYLRFIRLQ
jgi:DNA-directed RNA polymerase subunit N (RpoN/RPB10)